MVQILGVNLKNNTKVLEGLSQLYGLGKYNSKLMLNDMNIGLDLRIRDLTQSNLIKIIKWIEKHNIIIEGSLKQRTLLNIDRLKYTKTYRGLRHSYSLPSRGQRTKTNASTTKKLYLKRK